MPPSSPRPERRRPALLAALLVAASLAAPPEARAFCGFYVAKADASLYNETSRVVMVREGNRTVIGMASDYKGPLKEFAMVVPVPAVLQREQINVAERAVFDHLDAFTAPRLVEYFDDDPCNDIRRRGMLDERMSSAPGAAPMAGSARKSAELGVVIEAQYTVGEYDILILSARESTGLETWLRQNGYRIPPKARRALAPYIRTGHKFFVAKVNLGEQAKTGLQHLRPLQFAFESPKFMLPIRLGMANAKGPQDMLVYAITRKGRVETTNYRTVKLPTGKTIPVHLKKDFKAFYKAMFETAWKREDQRAVFTEHFWDMGWCDPCAADPLSADQLRQLGVWWLDDESAENTRPGLIPGRRRVPVPGGGPVDAVVTRLHVRYSAETFPEDLIFQETRDRENFQVRFVLQHPFTGPAACPEGKTYKDSLRRRQEEEIRTAANLTGWSTAKLRRDAGLGTTATPEPWWRNLWKR
ncbi:MAG: DUF2330 domain-containing protein [Candidatus Sericytochromatia bacterium]|nr:DUF2330 domain-containing protein [Candidatus Sericytochromatia bacterium]